MNADYRKERFPASVSIHSAIHEDHRWLRKFFLS